MNIQSEVYPWNADLWYSFSWRVSVLIAPSCKSYNRRTKQPFFYSILFYMSLIVCEVSVYVLLGHESYHSEMSISRCTVPVTGGCGRFRPAHTSVFFPCGEWQDIAHASFLTCSTIFSNVFRPTYSYYAPMIYTAPCIMIWMREYEGKWEGVGPWKSRFPGPNPFPLTQVMDMNASKTLCTGLYES